MIPIFDISINKKAKIYVNECLDSNWISSQGNFVKKLEKIISKYHKLKYCVVTKLHNSFTSSCKIIVIKKVMK